MLCVNPCIVAQINSAGAASGGIDEPWSVAVDSEGFVYIADTWHHRIQKFSPENAFNTGGSFGNSVSEFISNQLSYWITQVDENLDIDVDLGNFDQEAFNTQWADPGPI